jgi:hypothetical protein
MKLIKRIKLVWRVYRQLLPAIWESRKTGPYDAPTPEQVKAFMEEGDVDFGVKIGRVSTPQTCHKGPKEPPVHITEVSLNGY